MATFRLTIIALMASMLLLGACGRRGPLEPPPNAENEERQDRDFVLDPLVKQ